MYHVKLKNGATSVSNVNDLKEKQFGAYGGNYILVLETYENGAWVFNFGTYKYENIECSFIRDESLCVKEGDLLTDIEIYGDFKEVCMDFDRQLKEQGFKGETIWEGKLRMYKGIQEGF